MKVPQTIFGIIAAAQAALVLTGCDLAKDKTSIPAAIQASEGISFSIKNGLFIPKNTAQFIGLQIAEVAERKISSTLNFSAQIYRVTGETALASGNISPADAKKLVTGQSLSVQTGDGISLPARITSIQSALEKSSELTEVLLAISDAQKLLTTEAALTATIAIGGNQNVISVPRSALLQTTEGDFIYAVSGEHFVRTAVKFGSQDDTFVEITDGLYAGDQIVVKPVMTLWMAELQTLRGGKSCCAGH